MTKFINHKLQVCKQPFDDVSVSQEIFQQAGMIFQGIII